MRVDPWVDVQVVVGIVAYDVTWYPKTGAWDVVQWFKDQEGQMDYQFIEGPLRDKCIFEAKMKLAAKRLTE